MKKQLGILVALIVALGFLSQSAVAGERDWRWPWSVKDKRLAHTQAVVGIGSTVAYYPLRGHHSSGIGTGAYPMSTVGCVVVSPIAGALTVKRELTLREVHTMTANCILPFVGGWWVNAAYDAHPEWEKLGKKKR